MHSPAELEKNRGETSLADQNIVQSGQRKTLQLAVLLAKCQERPIVDCLEKISLDQGPKNPNPQ